MERTLFEDIMPLALIYSAEFKPVEPPTPAFVLWPIPMRASVLIVGRRENGGRQGGIMVRYPNGMECEVGPNCIGSAHNVLMLRPWTHPRRDILL